jgi:MFS superfamily sulfate permease-like transporter
VRFTRWCRRLAWVSPLGPITVATLSITAVWAGNLQDRFGVKIVGAIEAGLPRFTVGPPPQKQIACLAFAPPFPGLRG